MTDDLRRALERFAERGEPAGVEALVERIGDELGGRRPAPWPERVRVRTPRSRPWLLATAAALVVALAVAGVVVASSSGSGDSRRRVASGIATPERLAITARATPFPPGRSVTNLVAAGGSLWVATSAPGRGRAMLFGLDPTSGTIRARVALGGDAVGAAAGFGSLWVVTNGDGGRNELVRVDARSGDVQATITLATPAAVATGAGAVWVTDPVRGELARVDPATDAVVGSMPISGASAVAVAGGSVYVADRDSGSVTFVDAATLQVTRTETPLAGSPWDRLVASGRRVWAISSAGGTVRAFEPTPGPSAAVVSAGGTVTGVAPAPGGGLWLAVDGGRAGLGLLRPGAGRLVPAPRARGLRAAALAVTRPGIWTLDPTTSTLTLLEAR